MTEQNSNKTPFQIKLEERAKRLEQVIVTGCPSKGTFINSWLLRLSAARGFGMRFSQISPRFGGLFLPQCSHY